MSSSDSDDVAIDALFDPERLVAQSEERVQVAVGCFSFVIEQHLALRNTGQPERDAGTTEQTSTTGAVVWDGSVVAARFVHRNASSLLPAPGLCVELGCGVGGLTGLTLAKLGNSVVFTDLEAVLEPCRSNISANLELEKSSVSVRELVWGTQLCPEVREELAQVQLVVSTDTVYDPCLVEPLLSTVHRLLTMSSSAVAIVSYDTAIGRSRAYAEWEGQVVRYFEHAESVAYTDPRRQFDNGLDDKESVAVWILRQPLLVE